MLRIESKSRSIGRDVEFGKNVSISADSIEIENNVTFRDDVDISCRGLLRIGHHSIIGAGTRVHCNNLSIGHWFYSCEGLEIGAGGCNSEHSNVTIGNFVGMFERVLINPNYEVRIGHNSGIGREVQIWTHGAWLDPLAGFPSDFGPVTVGDNVWLPARTIMLPNSEIGDNSVIGINSIINKHVPPGSFAAGCPAKILKENVYPAPLSPQQTNQFITDVVSDWRKLIEFKAPGLFYAVEVLDSQAIRLTVGSDKTVFDCTEKTASGATNEYSEDLRDYLRRRGIKIYTNDFFRSMP